MEKYRIIQHDIKSKTFLVESTSGKVEIIEEGVFKDTFIRLKDAFVKFVKKGNKILTKIGGKLVDSVNNIYNTILHKQKYSHIFLNEEDADNASIIGLKNTNAEFDAFVEEQQKQNNINIAREMLQGLQYQAKRCLEELQTDNKVDEAYNTDVHLHLDTYRQMYPNASSMAYPENDNRDEGKYAGFSNGANGKHNYTKMDYPDLKIDTDYDIPDYTIDEIVETLDSRAKIIFEKKWDGNVYKNPRKGGTYKPYVIYGASGIGKTSIVHQLREKYGVSMIILSGNYMNEYTLSSPTSADVILYKIDKDGKNVFGEDGKPIKLGDRTGVDTVLTTTIPGMDVLKIEQDARLEISETNKNATKEEIEEFVKNRLIECDAALGKGILFIDEISRMPRGLMDSLMNLFDTGKIGNQKLGTNWMIVGALNPALQSKEQTIADNMQSLQEASRQRRLIRLNFIPTFESFINYGKSVDKDTNRTRLHPLVIKFLDNSTRMYHMMNVFYKVPEGKVRGNISNPALWNDLSDIMYDIDEAYGFDEGVSKDVNVLKKYIEKILKAVNEQMPYERIDMEDYLRGELLELSDDICTEAWDRNLGDKVKGNDDEVLVNSRINNGRGIALSTDDIVDKLYNNAPFVQQGKMNKNLFEENRKKYLLNIYDFITTFFRKGNEIDGRGKQILRQLLCERLPRMYDTPKTTGEFTDILGKDSGDPDYKVLYMITNTKINK